MAWQLTFQIDTKTWQELPDVFFRSSLPRNILRACGKIRLACETTCGAGPSYSLSNTDTEKFQRFQKSHRDLLIHTRKAVEVVFTSQERLRPPHFVARRLEGICYMLFDYIDVVERFCNFCQEARKRRIHLEVQKHIANGGTTLHFGETPEIVDFVQELETRMNHVLSQCSHITGYCRKILAKSIEAESLAASSHSLSLRAGVGAVVGTVVSTIVDAVGGEDMLDSLVREWRNYSSQRENFSQEATLQMKNLADYITWIGEEIKKKSERSTVTLLVSFELHIDTIFGILASNIDFDHERESIQQLISMLRRS